MAFDNIYYSSLHTFIFVLSLYLDIFTCLLCILCKGYDLLGSTGLSTGGSVSIFCGLVRPLLSLASSTALQELANISARLNIRECV
jgi:hypothetical protein